VPVEVFSSRGRLQAGGAGKVVVSRRGSLCFLVTWHLSLRGEFVWVGELQAMEMLMLDAVGAKLDSM